MATEAVVGAIDLGPAAEAAEARVKRRFVMKRSGKDYVLYAGLLDLLHQSSGGRFRLNTEVLQFPAEANGQVCVCRATVWMQEDGGGPERLCQGIGDASPQNTSAQIAAHLIRMAETRAKGRALRDLLNVGDVAFEELGPDDGGAAGGDGGETGDDWIEVEGQRFHRQVVWDGYQRRLKLARERGVSVTPDEGNHRYRDPLRLIVASTQSLRRRMDAGAAAPAGPAGG